MPQLVQENSVEKTPIVKKRKLPFGHYKLTVLKENSDGNFSEDIEAKPLNQDEISEGWHAVLPKLSSGNPVHHWSVTLAQLPPILWNKYKVEYDGGKEYIPIIKNNIYYYTVNKTAHDEELVLLYRELAKGLHSDNNVIRDLLSKLEVNPDLSKSNISGWLITRAKRFLSDKYEKYKEDMVSNF